MQFDPVECDPFVLLVHHRHAFRAFDFFRPIFSALILPEGFPAHPHRGFETVTYVLPGKGGLVHRDSLGCKMSYSNGACQWMTAGRGMLHEEMWDTASASEHELYQLWVNLPPAAKMTQPAVQLLTPPTEDDTTTSNVQVEGRTAVRRARIRTDVIHSDHGNVVVRTLAGDAGGEAAADSETTHRFDGSSTDTGASTFSPMTIAHIELQDLGATHKVPIPDGWTCIIYVRYGEVEIEGTLAKMYDTVYMQRYGGSAVVSNTNKGGSDVMIFAGQPIGAPVAASGTMVMNTQAQVSQALRDYQRGTFGEPWDHTLSDDDWVKWCDSRPI